MTWESGMDIPYNIRITVDIPVTARSREEAIERARAHLPDVEVTNIVARRNWQEVADRLFEEGMSQSEVAHAVGVERSNVARRFKGRGWTHGDGARYRELKRQLDELRGVL